MEKARRLVFAAVIGGTVLCSLTPAVADDELRFSPTRRVDLADHTADVVARSWNRDVVRPSSFEDEQRPSDSACDSAKGNPPSWTDAGTLFRWSFSNATGGPNLDEPLVTDRPDFTEATSTVGRGVAQVEFGYTYLYNRNRGVSVRSQSLGEPLLRYGVFANWLEFRAALFPVAERVVEAGRRSNTAGTEDLYLGFKVGLTPKDGILPEMSLIPQMTVPTGSPHFTDDEVLPGLNWCYGWEITDKFSTGGSTQFNRRVDETTGRAYLEYAQSWTTGYKFTDKLSMYAEWFAFIPHSADTAQAKHFFNFGFAYLINNDIQWDVRYGRGLNRAAEDYFVGTGLSIRFK
jgi:Putative MetA-pathway of phenol degradation